MAEAVTDPAPARRSRMPLIIGAVAALIAGGGGFYAMYSGLLGDAFPASSPSVLGDSAFVGMEPLVISLGAQQGGRTPARHLRFAATLEVPRRHQAEVEQLMPRVLDVMNSYLRAVEAEEFSRPGALIRLRAQMLRRIQIVTGEGRVRDLLVTEFVLN